MLSYHESDGMCCFVKPVSQIHRFHLRLGYNALTACFLVISMGGRTAPLLLQYCSSSFFHAAGAPFKAPASFNFSLKFSECRWRADKKKTHRKIVERWLYGALTGTAQLFSSASTIFSPLCGTDCLCAPGEEQECPPRATGRWPAVLKSVTCSRTGTCGASFSPPTARKLTTSDHFLPDI
jgi:hypothetical protein